MTPAKKNEAYINWKDYILFRVFFKSLSTFIQISNDIDSLIQQNLVSVKDREPNNFNNICQKIRELYNIMSYNDYCKNEKCCNYINYYIREKITDYFKYNDEEINKHFNIFVERIKTDNPYNICLLEIKYIEKAEFDKMNKLYDLYEIYENILNSNSEDNNYPNDCEYLNDFIEEYNEIIVEHKDDTYFNKELKNLRCSIENNKLYNNCKDRLTDTFNNSHNIINCNGPEEIKYLKEYSKQIYSYISARSSIQPANMNVIIATTLSSVILVTVLYYIYKLTTARNYLRNRFRRINKNIRDETYEHPMWNRKHYHRNSKGKCYNVSYVSERKY
ncbi:variable surface protein [Plasmodium gonderi]|uniref:Variable surface protein n=1 Tax=Plasmodium gonderi TaxID=77519 RepID=A0A1Y1JVM7_PLAGO|nr:variable surface protein [Plasmodium gonderi]GAW84423.1 variable surface protein [Plasmodium gonderi]